MRMDKLTTKFQQALADAQSLAVGRDNQYIEPVHLMVALRDQDGGTARPLLEKAGVQVPKLRSDLAAALDRIAQVDGAAGEVLMGNDLNKLLNVTDKQAQQRGHQFISSELFVLAACEDRGELGRLLKANGATRAAIEKAIDEVRGGAKGEDAGAEENRQALEKYSIDLTDRATQGKLDPGIGRDEGNSTHNPSSATAHEEQSRADRRARRGQDRDRRGIGPTHHQRRSTRGP